MEEVSRMKLIRVHQAPLDIEIGYHFLRKGSLQERLLLVLFCQLKHC